MVDFIFHHVCPFVASEVSPLQAYQRRGVFEVVAQGILGTGVVETVVVHDSKGTAAAID